MNGVSRRPSGPRKPGLRMKELAEATGLPKSTILHYVTEGLLPKPTKTSPNMAYYDEACIDRLKFIRHMQLHHRLSISEIRQLIEAKGEDADFSSLLDLNEMVFGPPEKDGLLDRQNFCTVTGLTADQANDLIQARLLLPLHEDQFDREDVGMGKAFAQAFSWGLRVEDLTYYVELGEKIVDHEMALKFRTTSELEESADAERTMKMVKNARVSRAYIIDRLFQHRIAGMKGIKDIDSKDPGP